tara:strand:- start:283 stop:939 length:657 start_codon:yes stop_codon:yes gene_type:complete
MNTSNFKNRLYGRTRGRSKKKINIKNYFTKLDQFKLNNFENNKNYILDIGTGNGETSIYLSKLYKHSTIIACDKYIDGNLNLLKQIENFKLKNILIHHGNVYEILEKNKNIYFDKVWIFFPDPWPKKKHYKRRLINKNFFTVLHDKLKDNGEICIVTDSNSYFKYILKAIYESKNLFHWKNQNKLYLSLKDYYDLETKYYKKAIISSRIPSLLILKKI